MAAAPANGTEVVTVQYMNSPNGESRDVFIEDGLMMYVTGTTRALGPAQNRTSFIMSGIQAH